MSAWGFLFQGFFVDLYFRFSCRSAFEYRQHKATLKKMQKERTFLERVLGLYSSGRTHAPYHMKWYKIMRVVNLLLCPMCIFLISVSEIMPYSRRVFDIYSLCVVIPALIDLFSLYGGENKNQDFSKSTRP